MRVHICAVGRLRAGPEQTLIDDYLKRFERVGRPNGLGPALVHEVDDRKAGNMATQAELLERAIPKGAFIVAMDERGKKPGSIEFSNHLSGWRDEGRGDVAFVIGGADGLDPRLRAQADWALSLGTMVWPHMLARVMLSEQLYRAATIMAGTPYHRA